MFSVVYHPEAREEATALPVKIRVKFDRLIGKLEYDARLLREPDTKPLGDGLFEIRTMGTDIARGIWVYHKGNTIIMLRVFIKKSQKTPAKEIDLAKKRLAEVLNEKLRELLAEWRKHDNLTKAQVAERMGVTPPVISRLENNITKASIDTLTRYAHACGIKKPVIALY